MKPLIGVTGPVSGGAAAWTMTALAVLRAGGRPRRITPNHPDAGWDLDGLIIGGGADVDPSLYAERTDELGEAVRASAVDTAHESSRTGRRLWGPLIYGLRRYLATGDRGPDLARDDLERHLLYVAVERDIPVLGICRGAQLMNVFFEGTLYPEVRELYVETPHVQTLLPKRPVEAAEDSLLYRAIGARRFFVNALNHQAIRTLGPRFRIVARDTAGMVQAIEDVDHAFRLGVQWHPEYIPQHPRQLKLFIALVRAARESARLDRTVARIRRWPSESPGVDARILPSL